MKYICTQTQRKIVFIPLINIMIIGLCLNNMLYVKADNKPTSCIFPYILRYAGLPGMVWLLLVGFLPTVAKMIYPIVMYIWPLCLGFGLIKYQEKHLDPLNK